MDSEQWSMSSVDHCERSVFDPALRPFFGKILARNPSRKIATRMAISVMSTAVFVISSLRTVDSELWTVDSGQWLVISG